MQQPPFVEKVENPVPGGPEYQGYCISLIENIKKIVDFNYTIYEVKDKMYGTINERNEWNGLIGELVSGVSGFCKGCIDRKSVLYSIVPHFPYNIVHTILYCILCSILLYKITIRCYILYQYCRIMYRIASLYSTILYELTVRCKCNYWSVRASLSAISAATQYFIQYYHTVL